MSAHTTIDYVAAYATALTAAGTLLLAIATFVMAWKTRALAESADKQIQLGRDELAAADRTLTEGIKARVDGVAPVVSLLADLQTTFLPGTDSYGAQEVLGNNTWPEAELGDIRVEVAILFRVTNHGPSPAHVFFPSLDPDLDNVMQNTGGSRYYVIPPHDEYHDRQTYRLNGHRAVEGIKCEFVLTCDGPVIGATFDTLRWRGTLQPLMIRGGVVRANDMIILNAAPAQFVREYPALDRPEEFRERAEAVRLGE